MLQPKLCITVTIICHLVCAAVTSSATDENQLSAPRNVRIVSCNERRATITWEASPSYKATPARLYRIQYSTSNSGGTWYDVQTIGDQELQASIELPADAEVQLRVVAYTANGPSAPGLAPEKCLVASARPDRNPHDVVGKGTTPTNMVISWTPMPIVQHNGPDFHYIVKWKQRGSNQKWQSTRVSHPVSGYTVENCQTYSPYDIIVQSENAIGASVLVPVKVVGYSGEDIPIVAPTNFRLTGRPKSTRILDSDETARFKWTPVNASTETIRGEFRGYRVFLIDRDNERRTWQTDILMHRKQKDHAQAPDVVGIVGNLIPATNYEAYVSVVNNRFIGPPSNKLQFKTKEKAPGPVGELNVVKATRNSLVVAWYPPKVPNGRIIGYTYSYSEVIEWALGKGVDGTVMLSSTTNHVQLNNLTPNSTYRVYVYAHTLAGRGPAEHVDVKLKTPPSSQNLPNDAVPPAAPTATSSRPPTVATVPVVEKGWRSSQSLEAVNGSCRKRHHLSYLWILSVILVRSSLFPS